MANPTGTDVIKAYVRVYDERTGDPATDNRNRRKNRALNYVCRRSVRFHTPKGRRRKKILTRVEYENYARLVALLAEEDTPLIHTPNSQLHSLEDVAAEFNVDLDGDD